MTLAAWIGIRPSSARAASARAAAAQRTWMRVVLRGFIGGTSLRGGEDGGRLRRDPERAGGLGVDRAATAPLSCARAARRPLPRRRRPGALTSGQDPGAASDAAAARRDIVEFYYPLALTAVMMAVSNPLINAGIARQPDATTGLAAYALAFNLSVLLHSPIFMAQQTAVALVKCGGSYRSVRRFTYALGVALALFEGAIAWSPLGRLIYLHLYGAEPRVAEAAVVA